MIVNGMTPVVTSIAREDQDLSCLYIEGFVGEFQVKFTLVDGHVQIELVSKAVVRRISCKTYGCKDTSMRLANDTVILLPCYTWLDINVSGVLGRVKAYVMPIEMSFLILFSRRWLARVLSRTVRDMIFAATIATAGLWVMITSTFLLHK
jgi:hypothetical protein